MVDSSEQISAMREGGAKLRVLKKALQDSVKVGTRAEEIEQLAQDLISQAGGRPNFSLVRGYDWATCVMINSEVCHGIPKNKVVADGDLVSIDVGMLYQGWHLDTSISFGVGNQTGEQIQFLSVGKQALKKAISRAKPGASVYDLSFAMQKTVERQGYSPVLELTGHGIGRELHMEPNIPCIAVRRDKKIKLVAGQTLAIEIMYALGEPDLKLASDGWTYLTRDGSLTAMFEETVLVGQDGPVILT